MMSIKIRSSATRMAAVFGLVAILAIPAQVAHGRNAAAIKYGGSVTVSAGSTGNWPDNFNPGAGGNASNYGTNGLIYEPLVFYNGLTGKQTPWLAKKMTWSKDLKTLTFTIRTGVRWTDGKPFTPADVVFSAKLAHNYTQWDPGMDPYLAKNYITQKGNKVSFHFKTVNTTLSYYVGFQLNIVPQHIWKNVSNPVTFTNPNPVGTGPFMLKKGDFSPTLYTLTKNPNYWQHGKPYISALRYPAYTGNDAILSDLQTGKIQWGGTFVNNAQTVLVKNGAAGNHYWYNPANNPVILMLNLTKQPFSNVYVRRAISEALNRQQLYQQGEYGYEPPSNAAFLQPQFVKTWGDPKIVNSISKTGNMSAAQKDIASARKNAATADALTKTYNLNVEAGWTDWDATAALIANQLKAIGLNVNVNQLAFPDPMPVSTLHTGNFDMGLNWTSSGIPSPYPIFHDWFWSRYYQPVGTDAIFNWERYKSAKMDSYINSYARTAKLSQQVSIMKKMEALAAKDVPAVPLLTQALWYEYNDSKFTGFPSAKNPYDLGPSFEKIWEEDVALHLHLK